jgi:hypothetical protein
MRHENRIREAHQLVLGRASQNEFAQPRMSITTHHPGPWEVLIDVAANGRPGIKTGGIDQIVDRLDTVGRQVRQDFVPPAAPWRGTSHSQQ